MHSLDQCIKEAERCERIAISVSHPILRQTFSDIAVMWRKLAHTTSERARGMLVIMDIGDGKPHN